MVDYYLDYYLKGTGMLLGSPITYFFYFSSVIGSVFMIYYVMNIVSFVTRHFFRSSTQNFQ